MGGIWVGQCWFQTMGPETIDIDISSMCCFIAALSLCWLTIPLGYWIASDGKFTTAKTLVPQCLDMCDTLIIWRFFQKTWRYIDAYAYISLYLCFHVANLPYYSKGLNTKQTAFAVKKYKSHHHVGLPSDIIALMHSWTQAFDTQKCSFSSPRPSSPLFTQNHSS